MANQIIENENKDEGNISQDEDHHYDDDKDIKNTEDKLI